jgi:hypothetical protein
MDLSAIFNADISPNEKYVMVAIAHFLAQNSRWPTQIEIAKSTSLSETTVRRAIKKLKSGGKVNSKNGLLAKINFQEPVNLTGFRSTGPVGNSKNKEKKENTTGQSDRFPVNWTGSQKNDFPDLIARIARSFDSSHPIGLIIRVDTSSSIHELINPSGINSGKIFISDGPPDSKGGSLRGENDVDLIEFPAELNSTEFREAWAEWVRYRQQAKIKNAKYTKIGRKRILKMCAEMRDPIAAIAFSIAQGYQGIFEPGRAGRPKVDHSAHDDDEVF